MATEQVDSIPDITLYRRRGCHLCDDMLSELRLCLADRQYHLNQVDIEDSRELVEKWGSKVPVLCLGDKEICHFFLDNNALHAALVQKL